MVPMRPQIGLVTAEGGISFFPVKTIQLRFLVFLITAVTKQLLSHSLILSGQEVERSGCNVATKADHGHSTRQLWDSIRRGVVCFRIVSQLSFCLLLTEAASSCTEQIVREGSYIDRPLDFQTETPCADSSSYITSLHHHGIWWHKARDFHLRVDLRRLNTQVDWS